MDSNSFEIFTDALEFWAKKCPNKCAFQFISNNAQTPSHSISYAELLLNSQQVARHICQHTQTGDRVILAMQPSLDYIIFFLACIQSQRIAVPMYPPANTNLAQKLINVIDDSKPSLMIVDRPFEQLMRYNKPAMMLPHWMINKLGLNKPLLKQIDNIKQKLPTFYSSDSLLKETTSDIKLEKSQTQSIAYLQYTSGSTGDPKGVMVGHQNIITNVYHLKHRAVDHFDSRKLIWIPPYHDMGLVYGIIESIVCGMTTFLMSPLDFIKDPIGWLKAIDRYDISVSIAPNFAFELCIKRVNPSDRSSLDLSSLETLISGAEPIKLESVRAFYQTFKACGLQERTFSAAYGLAEVTLGISGIKASPNDNVAYLHHDKIYFKHSDTEVPANAFPIVSTGEPYEQVEIIDELGDKICQEDQIGEIIVSGKSNCMGYWEKPEQTKQTFHYQIPSSNSKDFYLKTGDLGFLHDGQLYITGRKKDVIIVHGVNTYPQDIEYATTETNPGLRAGCCAAFTNKQDDDLVIVCEIKNNLDETKLEQICQQISQTVVANFALKPKDIVLIKQRSIPKTTSGKIARRECRTLFNTHRLPIVYHWNNQASARDYQLIEIIETTNPKKLKQALGSYLEEKIKNGLAIDAKVKLDWNKNIFDYGINSISMNEITQSLSLALQKKQVVIDNLFLTENNTINRIVDFICKANLHLNQKSTSLRGSEKQDLPKALLASTYQLLMILSMPILWFGASGYMTLKLYTALPMAYPAALILAPIFYFLWFVLSCTILIGLKWLIIGRFSQGHYPVYGAYYYRWWTMQLIWNSFSILFLPMMIFIESTKVLNILYRLLGAKIGKNVSLESVNCFAWDLIEIGDHQHVETGRVLNPCCISHQHLVLKPIIIEASEYSHCDSFKRIFFQSISIGVLLPSIIIYSGLLISLGSTMIANAFNFPIGFEAKLLLFIPLFFFLFPWVSCLIKWLLVGKIHRKIYHKNSGFALRYWFVKRLMDFTDKLLDVCSATPLYNQYLKSCGSKIKKGAVLLASAKLSSQADLVSVGKDCFISNAKVLADNWLKKEYYSLKPIVLESDCSIGLAATLHGGSMVYHDSAVGAKSILKNKLGPNQLQFIDQSMQRNSVKKGDASTLHFWYYASLMRFPILYGLIALGIYLFGLIMVDTLPIAFNFIFAYYFAFAYGLLLLWLTKWLLIGGLKKGEYNLSDKYIQFAYLITVPITWLCRDYFIKLLVATPFINLYYRSLGAKIGHNTIINTPVLYEWDLVSIGNHVRINADTYVIGHLLMDGIYSTFKLNEVKIGNNCIIGRSCILFPGTTLANNTVVPDNKVFGGR